MSSTKLLEENMDVFCAIQEISKTLEDFRIQILKNQILRQQEWEELMENRSKRNQMLENLASPSKPVWKPPDLCEKPSLNGSRLREEEFSEPPKSRQMTCNFIKKSKREDSEVNKKSDEKGKMSSLTLTAEKRVDVEILKTSCRNLGVAERSINNEEGIVAEPKSECQDENIEAEMINDAKANITEYTKEPSTDEAVEEGYNCHTETTLGQQAKDAEDKIVQKVKRDIPGKQCPQEFHVSDLEIWGVARNTISRETEKETIIEEMQFGVDTYPITNTEIVQTNPKIHIVVAEEKITLIPISAPQIEVNDVEQLPKIMIGNERCCTTPNMVVIEKLNIEDYKEVVHVFKPEGLRPSLMEMNSNYHIFTYTHVCIMGLLYVVKNVSSSDSSSNEGIYLLGSKSCCLVSCSTLKLLSNVESLIPYSVEVVYPTLGDVDDDGILNIVDLKSCKGSTTSERVYMRASLAIRDKVVSLHCFDFCWAREKPEGEGMRVDELVVSKLGLPQRLVETLQKLGITELFPIQRAVQALGGRDIIARAETGTGGTLALGVSILKGFDEAQQDRSSLGEVPYLVLDEADQMLAVGFEGDVEVIMGKLPSQRHSMLFSEVMPSWVKKLARKFMNNPLTIDLVGDHEEKLAEAIKLYALPNTSTSKRSTLGDLVTVCGKGGKAIVFTQTKRDADEVSIVLTNSIVTDELHGDISQHQRVELFPLERKLSTLYKGKSIVASTLLVCGMVLKEEDNGILAKIVLVKSVNDYPWELSTWLERQTLCTEIEALSSLHFNIYIDKLWLRKEFLKEYEYLHRTVSCCHDIQCQSAKASYDIHGIFSCCDYQAWYGIGKTYEMILVPYSFIEYLGKSKLLQQNNFGGWNAMIQCYEAGQIHMLDENISSHKQAANCNVRVGIVLHQLAQFHGQLNSTEEDAFDDMKYLVKMKNRTSINQHMSNEVFFWTEARNSLLAESQISKQYKLTSMGENSEIGIWIANNFPGDEINGVDPWCKSPDIFQKRLCALTKRKMIFTSKSLEGDEVWSNRPPPGSNLYDVHSLEVASGIVKDKVEGLGEKLMMEKNYKSLPAVIPGLRQRLCRDSNKTVDSYAPDGWSMLEGDAKPVMTIQFQSVLESILQDDVATMTKRRHMNERHTVRGTVARVQTDRTEAKDKGGWLSAYFPDEDPWGQGSQNGRGNVMIPIYPRGGRRLWGEDVRTSPSPLKNWMRKAERNKRLMMKSGEQGSKMVKMKSGEEKKRG